MQKYTFSSPVMVVRSLSSETIASCLIFGKSVFGIRISSLLISFIDGGGPPGGNR